MAYLATRGLVLRETKIKENDSLLTILSEHGKLTVKARSVRTRSSKIRTACQLLVYSEFTLYEQKGYYTVNEAESIEQFSGLRTDLELISLASYFAQIAENVSDEDRPNPELLSLILNCLYGLSVLRKPQALVKAAFELKLMCIAGYEPSLEGCAKCGDESVSWFDTGEGALLCGKCCSGVELPVGYQTLLALKYFVYCPAKKLLAIQLGEDTQREVSAIAERYVLTQLERGFSTLDFYKSLSVMLPSAMQIQNPGIED